MLNHCHSVFNGAPAAQSAVAAPARFVLTVPHSSTTTQLHSVFSSGSQHLGSGRLWGNDAPDQHLALPRDKNLGSGALPPRYAWQAARAFQPHARLPSLELPLKRALSAHRFCKTPQGEKNPSRTREQLFKRGTCAARSTSVG